MGLVGTTDEVLSAFVRGEAKRTAKAPVPGAYRVVSVDVGAGVTHLFSYNTLVAANLGDGRFAVTPKKYSVTTSRLVNQLRRMLPPVSGETVQARAAVPGRWGGFGPAWHPTGYDILDFLVHGVKR